MGDTVRAEVKISVWWYTRSLELAIRLVWRWHCAPRFHWSFLLGSEDGQSRGQSLSLYYNQERKDSSDGRFDFSDERHLSLVRHVWTKDIDNFVVIYIYLCTNLSQILQSAFGNSIPIYTFWPVCRLYYIPGVVSREKERER